MGYILWITTELQWCSKIRYTTFCKRFSHKLQKCVRCKKPFWPNKHNDTAPRLPTATSMRLQVAPSGERKRKMMNAVTSSCCIKFLQACNHVAILMYWGTLCHLKVFAALGSCVRYQKYFPHVDFRIILLSIKFNANSVLKETCAWVNLLPKLNWKPFDQCY